MLDFEPRLEIRVIWHDPDIVELQIAASSEHFAGRADIYASYDQLQDFTSRIAGFPAAIGDRRSFQFATSDTQNRASLTFSVVNSLGLAVANVEIVERTRGEESARARIFVEAAAIDEFATQLRAITAEVRGCAVLRGRIGAYIAHML